MKKIVKNISVFIMALAVLLSVIPAQKVEAASKITVTFRAGAVGSFDVNTAKSLANNNVEVSKNFVKITVEKPQSGSVTLADVVKAGFGRTDVDNIFLSFTEHKNYTLLSSSKWGVDLKETIKHNKEYVLDYGTLVDPVMYSVRYVDVSSYDETKGVYTNEIAAPIINYGNDGDVITVYSAIIDQYATVVEKDEITLKKGEDNSYIFFYDYTGTDYDDDVVYIDTVDELTEEQVVRIENARRRRGNGGNGNGGDNGNGGNNGNGDDNGNGNGEETDPTVIPDDDTPKNGGSSNGGGTNIEDNPTPLAANDTVNVYMIAGMIFAILLVATSTLVIIFRRKANTSAIGPKDSDDK